MFQRIELEAWLQQLPQYALWIFMGVFILSVLRILLTPKKEVRYLEALPLDKETARDEK